MKLRLVAAILLLTPGSAFAHRLDEYLEATLIAVGRNQIEAELTLTPGVAVFPVVAAAIDTDGDGVFSPTEQRAYVNRVLRDLSLTIDGRRLTPRLRSMRFSTMDEMKAGLGTIRIEIQADLPRGGPGRRLVFENRHQSRLGAYLVNCLVPADPEIRIVAQNRNYSQSVYQLDYVQAGVTSNTGFWSGGRVWLAGAALLLLGRLAFLWHGGARAMVAPAK